MLPIFNDGKFHLYKLEDEGRTYPSEKLIDKKMDICFQENGIGDSLKSELKQNQVEVTTKITIPQYREINSRCVLEIDGIKHKVYNVYHCEDKDGFAITNITLERYRG